MTTELIIVVDQIEDDVWEGKKYKKITSKSGETYKIGAKLQEKWTLLVQNTPLRLIMDVYNGKDYVKDFDRCYDLTQDKLAELSKPKKNIKDISIEAQVAVKAVTDLLCTEHAIILPQDIVDMTFEWIRKSLKEATE